MFFAIGDIHGEIEKLTKLIKIILSFDNFPTLLFIGDYIDKGKNSKAVLDYLIELKFAYKTFFLFGNHEYHWLNVAKNKESVNYLQKYGGQSTVESFGGSDIFDTHNILTSQYGDIFNNLKPYHIENNYLFVHSGIPPEDYKKNINTMELKNLLFNRYSFISHMERYLRQYTIVFGHTGFYFPYIDPYKIGIDTAAVYLESQPLTSFCIEKQMLVNSKKETKHIKMPVHQILCPCIVRQS